jgi:hypothetical protein
MKQPPPSPCAIGCPGGGCCFLCDTGTQDFYLFGHYLNLCPEWMSMRRRKFNYITQTANYIPPLVCADCEKTKCSVGAYLTFFGVVFIVDTKISVEKMSEFFLASSDGESSSYSQDSISQVAPEPVTSSPLLPPKKITPPKLLLMQIDGQYWVLLHQLKKVFGLGWIRACSEASVKEKCPSARLATLEQYKIFNQVTVKKSSIIPKLMVLLEEIVSCSTSMTLAELLKSFAIEKNATKNLVLTFDAGNIDSEEMEPPAKPQPQSFGHQEQLVEFQMFWTLPTVPLRHSPAISIETKNNYTTIINEYLAFCKTRADVESPRLSEFFNRSTFLSYIDMYKNERNTKKNEMVPYYSTAIAVLKFLLSKQLNGNWEGSPLIREMIERRNNAMWLNTSKSSSSSSFSSVNLDEEEKPSSSLKKKRHNPRGSYEEEEEENSESNSFVEDDEKSFSLDEDYSASSEIELSSAKGSSSSVELEGKKEGSRSCEIIPPPSTKELRRKQKRVVDTKEAAPPPQPKRQKTVIPKLKSEQLAVLTSTLNCKDDSTKRFEFLREDKSLLVYVMQTRFMFKVRPPLQTLAQRSFISKIDKTCPNGKHIDVLLAHLLYHSPKDDKIPDLIEHDPDRTNNLLKYLVKICENPSITTCTDIVRTFKFTSSCNELKNLENMFSALARIRVYERIGSREREVVTSAMDRVFAANDSVRSHGASNESLGDFTMYCPELVENLLYLPITVLTNTASVCVAYITADERKNPSVILDALIKCYKLSKPDLRVFFTGFLK